MTVSSLAHYWTSNAQPLVQQADVLGVALDMSIGIAVLFDPCGLLVEKLWEVAGVVDDDAVALLHDTLGELPLKLMSMFCRLVEQNIGIEQTGQEDVMIDDCCADRASKKSCYGTEYSCLLLPPPTRRA
jgi:hypothetical protein